MTRHQDIRDKSQGPRKPRISHHAASNICIFYLLLMLGFLAWQLFDTWIGRYSVLTRIGYDLQGRESIRLIAFTLLAGALGGVINGLRSTIHYHEKFERRHTWKYFCAPWMGATLALFVFALLRTGMDVLGGDSAGTVGNGQVLSNFSVGALVGYGSKDVFVWLDARVTKLFNATATHNSTTAKPSAPNIKARQRKRKSNRVLRPKPIIHSEPPVTISNLDRAN